MRDAAQRGGPMREGRPRRIGPRPDSCDEVAPELDGTPCFFARERAGEIAVSGALAWGAGHILPGPAGVNADGERADGIFAEWRWDGERLEVVNDRYGFFPLFYYCSEDEFAISPSLAELLRAGAPAEIDRRALAVFLHLGFYLGDDTPFSHIKAVPPNDEFIWDGALHVRERRAEGGRLAISRADAIGRYRDLFREAIARRLPSTEKCAVPLSGGRDSRHILLELCRAGRPPTHCVSALSYDVADDDDAEIARLLASELGVSHTLVPQLPRIPAELRKNVLTHFCADEHAWLVPVGDFAQASVTAIYDGIGGDVLSASLFQKETWLELYWDGRLEELAGTLMGADTSRLQPALGASLRAADGARVAHERVVAELERHRHATNPLTMFFFWNRTRREIALAPFGVLSGVETCYCPYLDHAVFDFLASLPPSLLLDERFHTETIAEAHPRFAAFPYSQAHRSPTNASRLGLAARVMWHNVRREPARASRLLRAGAQMLQAALSPSYRNENAVLGPVMLLYLAQLEDVARGLSG